jgi:surface antigen
MSVTVHTKRDRLRSAFAVALTVLTLVPVGVLFVQVWDDAANDRDAARAERHGVEYLVRLGPLLTGVAKAQVGAAPDGADGPDGLPAAVGGVTEVDRRLGAELGAQQRWKALATRIDALAARPSGTVAGYHAHVETTDLLLALYRAVRDNARLGRDPANDVAQLSQAAADNLPTAVIQAARMADLSVLLTDANANERRQLGPEFGASVQAVSDSVNRLTDSLQAAVEDTSSRTLSSNLLGTLDSFRRSVEGMARGANSANPTAQALATARLAMQQTAGALGATMLTELDGLLRTQLNDLSDRQLRAAAVAALAVLLAVATIGLPRLIGRRSRQFSRTGGTDSGRLIGDAVLVRHTGARHDPAPRHGVEFSTTSGRERTGALR